MQTNHRVPFAELTSIRQKNRHGTMANTCTIVDAPRSIESMTTHRPTSACFARGKFSDVSEDAESE